MIRQSLGEPDLFKLKYRSQIRELISAIIIGTLNSKEAGKLIRSKAEQIPNTDQGQFIAAVETELLALHEGNFARYRVSPKEFERWNAGW